MSPWEKDRVFALLRWAAFARRALTVEEITEAVLITQFEELDPDEYPDEYDDDYVRTEIVGLCGPLLEVKNMFVYIPHFSVRQYLGQHLPLPSWIQSSNQLQSSYEAYHHTVIARACLQYFNQPQVWYEKYEPDITARSLRWYAIGAWVKHMTNAFHDASVWELATDLMREENLFWRPFSEYVAATMNRQHREKGEPENHEPPYPLEYALGYGWKDMASHLISETNVNRRGSYGRTPLLQACKADMPEIVQKLLQAGADLTCTATTKQTPLHLVAYDGPEETVKALLNYGADTHAQDEDGWTPLHAASSQGNLKCCQLLIRHGADPTIKDSDGMSALHRTCLGTNKTEVARLILQNGPDGMTLEQCSVGSPLHIVCVTGDIEMAKLLLDYDDAASLSILNEVGATPAMIAASKGHTEMVKLLLDRGSDNLLSNTIAEKEWTLLHLLCGNIAGTHEDASEMIKATLRPGVEDSMLMADRKGCIPLHIAAQTGKIKAIELILNYKHGNVQAMLEAKNGQLHTPLWIAARHGHTEMVKTLLDHGAVTTISTIGKEGKSALWIASRYGHTDIVRELLSRGAEETIAVPTIDGDTPLWVASRDGRIDIVKLLIDHGAESTIAVADVTGETPLHVASRGGHLEIVRMLISHGDESTIEFVDIHNETALYAASETGQVEIVRELLTHGAKSTVATITVFGNSPLHAACKSGKLDIVQQLLDNGAEATVTVANNEGNTPLHEALKIGHTGMVKLLVRHGAKSTIRLLNEDGECPLYVAAVRGDIEPVDQLLQYGVESDIATLTVDNRSPIFAAAESANLKLFQRLLSYPEAEPTLMLIDDWNKSLLFAASQGGCVEIVEELLGRGIGKHIALAAKSGDTALSIAAHNGFADSVTLLLSVPGVSVNHANNYDVTPLFSAARFGHIETVKALLSSPDIELDCENWKGLTPLHAAVANGHVETVKLLIKNGASIIVWPVVGYDLLWWAKRTGNPDMVELLQSNGLTEGSLNRYLYSHKEAPADDAAIVVFNDGLGYCDVCTLSVEDIKGYGCNKCWQEFWDEILICSECFDRDYNVCIKEHALVPRKKLDY